jgi:hypothetical protein
MSGCLPEKASQDHKNVCDSNSSEAEMCIEYFHNRTQICYVISHEYLHIAEI